MAHTPPEMHEVTSSNVHSIGHCGAALWIKFKGKDSATTTYRYEGAPPELLDHLKGAESVGREFQNRVRHQYQGVKV